MLSIQEEKMGHADKDFKANYFILLSLGKRVSDFTNILKSA